MLYQHPPRRVIAGDLIHGGLQVINSKEERAGSDGPENGAYARSVEIIVYSRSISDGFPPNYLSTKCSVDIQSAHLPACMPCQRAQRPVHAPRRLTAIEH